MKLNHHFSVVSTYSSGNLGLGELNLHIHGKDRPLQKWNFDDSAFDKLTKEAQNNRNDDSGSSPGNDCANLDDCDEFALTSLREEVLEDEDALSTSHEKDSRSSCNSSSDSAINYNFDKGEIDSGCSIYNGDSNVMDVISCCSSSSSSSDRGSSSNNIDHDNGRYTCIDDYYGNSEFKVETSDIGTIVATPNTTRSIKVRNIKRDRKSNPSTDLKVDHDDKSVNLQVSKQKKIQKRMLVDENDSDEDDSFSGINKRDGQTAIDGRSRIKEDDDGYKGQHTQNRKNDNNEDYENQNDYDFRNTEEENKSLCNRLIKKVKKSSDRKRDVIDKSDRVRDRGSSNSQTRKNDSGISDTKKKKRKKDLTDDTDIIVKQGSRRLVQNESKSKQSVSSDSKKLTPSVICPICENEVPLGKLSAEHVLDKHIDKCSRRMDSVTVKRGRISKGFYNENNDIQSDSENESQDDNDDEEVISSLSNKGRRISFKVPDKNNADVSIKDHSKHDGDDDNPGNPNVYDKRESFDAGSRDIEDWMECEDSSVSSNDGDDAYSDQQDTDVSTNSEDSSVDKIEISSRKKQVSNSKERNERKKKNEKNIKKGIIDIVDHKLDKKEKKRAEKLLKINRKSSRGTGVDDSGRRVKNRQGRMVEDKVVGIFI